METKEVRPYICCVNNDKHTTPAPMYFSVKAFSASARRFENLDNIQELNDFVNEYVSRGFTKFIVKSYDCNGARFASFFSTVANAHGECAMGLGGQDGFAVRIAKRDLVEA